MKVPKCCFCASDCRMRGREASNSRHNPLGPNRIRIPLKTGQGGSSASLRNQWPRIAIAGANPISVPKDTARISPGNVGGFRGDIFLGSGGRGLGRK
jgi:hypothetical protein